MNIRHEIKLMHFIEKNLGRPFVWGTCDCNVFVLEVMDAVFDTVLAGKIKGRYKTEKGAIRFRRLSKWGSLITLLKEAGFIEIQKGFAQTGDLLIVEEREHDPNPENSGSRLRNDKWEVAHICLGNRGVTAFPKEGVQYFPMAMMKDKQYSGWRPAWAA